ncbi:POP1-domain-containing protein [Amylocystis lapponica]|nr:POP1-domain-containing protein [Amylocystis lapponica]
MALKRKGDAAEIQDEPSARDRKKQKTAEARTIAVQSNNAAAGSSKSVRFDSMRGLPGSLDVERFAEARAFEINAMHDAMQNASSNATQRAWQQLPRHLRRRAASHDVRRVPLRLREKARAEMDPMRRKVLGRSKPKLGKTKRITRTRQLLKRQRDKTWLETHLWHAKRMKMENMWGYRLAIHPTEKSFRPSHRASVRGSILHDASYYALIELKGPESILRALLDRCCDYQSPSPGAKRYLTGARACETHIYKHDGYPFDLIAPIMIIWQAMQMVAPKPVPLPQPVPQATSAAERRRKRKGKGKASETAPAVGNVEDPARIVWVRAHPSVVGEVHLALRTAASFALEIFKKSAPEKEVQVEIADLREHVNVFEIMGPKASQVLKGALKPVTLKERPEFRQFWNSLSRLQTSGSCPRGMIIGFTVHDPRLSFPPKNAKLDIDIESGVQSSPPVSVFPSSALAQSDIWDEQVREPLRKPRFKKKDIDQRRSQNLVPGTSLKAGTEDDRVPVMLIQRSVESVSPLVQSSPQHSGDSPSLHGWTLVVPSGWGMPLFSSLTYTGTRVGGQRERQTQAFEAGCAYFPRDYPCTDAYAAYADDREDEDRERWERKPPAKRTNFEKMGTRSPWRPDWGVVLGVEEPPSELISAQRDDVAAEGRGEPGKEARTWLLRGADVPAIVENLSSMLNPGAGLLDCVNQLRSKRKQDPLEASLRADELFKTALVLVRVILCGRGAPEDLAVIYSVDDDEARQWTNAEALRKQGTISLEEGEDETEARVVSTG